MFYFLVMFLVVHNEEQEKRSKLNRFFFVGWRVFLLLRSSLLCYRKCIFNTDTHIRTRIHTHDASTQIHAQNESIESSQNKKMKNRTESSKGKQRKKSLHKLWERLKCVLQGEALHEERRSNNDKRTVKREKKHHQLEFECNANRQKVERRKKKWRRKKN